MITIIDGKSVDRSGLLSDYLPKKDIPESGQMLCISVFGGHTSNTVATINNGVVVGFDRTRPGTLFKKLIFIALPEATIPESQQLHPE